MNNKLDAQKLADDKKLAKELDPDCKSLPNFRKHYALCKVSQDQSCQ